MSKNLQAGLFIFLLIFLFSCFSGNEREEFYNEQGNLVVKEWYNKHSLKSSFTYLDDSLKNYVYVSYYSDGRLKDSAKYINDTVEGLRKFYESSTGLTHFENYNNGLLNGVHKAEFSTGVKSFEGFRKNNQMVGEWKFHYPNGKLITYEYYDSVGRVLYFRKYDENENVLKANGTELIQVYSKQTKVKVGELCSGFVETALPPNSELMLSIEEIGTSKIFYHQIVKSPVTKWEIIFDNAGEQKLLFKLEVKIKKSGEMQEYTFNQNLIVEAD